MLDICLVRDAVDELARLEKAAELIRAIEAKLKTGAIQNNGEEDGLVHFDAHARAHARTHEHSPGQF